MHKDKPFPVILDDASLTEAQRNDLRAFLASQNEVTSFGAFIPELQASAGVLVSQLAGALTTVYVLIPSKAKGAAVAVLKSLVGKWLEKHLLPVKEKSPIEYVTILDQYGRPVVKIEVPPTPKGKH
jgi:hypothetical protein